MRITTYWLVLDEKWTECADEAAMDDGLDLNSPVVIVEENAKITLRCDMWYGMCGHCELSVTHLDRESAQRLFARLMKQADREIMKR